MPLSNAKLVDLKAELDSDPLARGYAAMTDGEATIDLNTVYRQRVREILLPEELREQIDWTEYEAKTNRQATDVQFLASNGPINVAPGTFGRNALVGIFGGGSTTIGNLLNVLTEDISRAEELFGQSVVELDVARARAL